LPTFNPPGSHRLGSITIPTTDTTRTPGDTGQSEDSASKAWEPPVSVKRLPKAARLLSDGRPTKGEDILQVWVIVKGLEAKPYGG